MLKRFLWKLMLFLWFLEAVHAFPLTMGLEFAVALPRIMNKTSDRPPVLFILTTFQTDEFKVKFQFVIISEEITVSKKKAGKYVLPDKYESRLYEQVGPKPSFYFVTDVFPFGLTVHLFNMNVSASSLTALPITAWGRQYYTVNLRGMPSYQIISSSDQNYITIKIAVFLSNFTISYRRQIIKNKDVFKTKLQIYEAFAISACDDEKYEEGDMSRTRIIAEWPVGVVSGNCLTTTDTYTCYKNEKVENGDIRDGTAEMLMPSEYFGTEFIIFVLPYRGVPSKVIIVSPTETSFAAVNVSIGSSGSVRTIYVGLTDNVHVEITEHTQISSSLPIQLMYVQRSGCLTTDPVFGEGYGDVTFSIVLPTSLYYVAYIWSNPEYATVNLAVLIAPSSKTENFYLNNSPLGSIKCERVAGSSIYRVCHLHIYQGDNIIKSSPVVKFGCYLYGYAPGMAYMHPAGFQDCKLSQEEHFMRDNIDNDCDGLTDEEDKNKRDDDGDNLIDEDLRIEPNANGEWGAWKSWICNENCSFPLLYHRRLCDYPPPQGSGEPCKGPDTEFKNVTCVPKMNCPEKVCPKNKWGPSCLWDCSHCSSNCNQLNGSCIFCKSGWKNSKHGCDQKCGLFEWGENCLYSCYEKCWGDCIDRETGGCSTVTFVITVLPWVVCFVLIIAAILMRNKKSKRQEIMQARVSTDVLEEKSEPRESERTKGQGVKLTSPETTYISQDDTKSSSVHSRP